MSDSIHAAGGRGRSGPVGYLLAWLARALAIFGGFVLLAMMALLVVSVGGRYLADSPVQGDFELVQIGCAICVTAFLPYCQLQRGHVIVDFFTMKLSARCKRWLDVLGGLVLAAAAALLAWRMALGAWGVKEAREASMILDLPVWWGYALMVPSFALLAAVALHTAWTQVSTRHER
jgi:TRAP-type C4-dicarboxylate transport system permease small subunit